MERVHEKKLEKLLPKTAEQITNGGIYKQRVRCGKLNCGCARGAVHTGYYFFTRRNGKLTKVYIPKAELDDFSDLVNQATTIRKGRRLDLRKAFEMLKKFRQQLRDAHEGV